MTDMLHHPAPVVPVQDPPPASRAGGPASPPDGPRRPGPRRGLAERLLARAGVPTGPRTGTAVAVGAVVLGLVVGTGVVAGQAFAPEPEVDRVGPGAAYATETERVLAEDLEVGLGRFRATRDDLGLVSSRLPVRLTNTSGEPRSYDVAVRAFASDGTRVAADTAVVDDVAPGERRGTVLFELVDDDTAAALESARFRVVRATAY
jgi:hypothetical protein